MPSHFCLDPQDPYAQSEVFVEFERSGGDVTLISARDSEHDDILSDLEDIQRRAIENEIAEDCPQDVPFRDARLSPIEVRT